VVIRLITVAVTVTIALFLVIVLVIVITACDPRANHGEADDATNTIS
jgi:phage shock protein PspC (stress-responsive transcriptional regulator)